MKSLVKDTMPYYGYTLLGNPIPASYRAPIVETFSIAEVKYIIRLLSERCDIYEVGLANTGHLVRVDHREVLVDTALREFWADCWTSLQFQIRGYKEILDYMMNSTYEVTK